MKPVFWYIGFSLAYRFTLAAPSTSSCIIGVNSRKSIGLVYTHLHIIKWAPLPLAKRDLHFERKVLSTWVHGYLVLACYLIDVACPDGSVYIHDSTRYQIRYFTRGEGTLEARHQSFIDQWCTSPSRHLSGTRKKLGHGRQCLQNGVM